MIKLSDYVVQRIVDEGVRHVFLLPGGGSMHLVDSVGRNQGIQYVCNLHEQACAISADSYGQYTNNLGAALVTTGPGGTNTVTGVAAAWLESTACLFVSGQVKSADIVGDRGVRQLGFQEINIVKVVEPITKYAVTVLDPMSIRYHLEKAIYLAKHGRPGPVWIDIPLDVQAAQIDENKLEGFMPPVLDYTGRQVEISEKVRQTIDLLNRSNRPVILAGNGIRLANAFPEFLQLTTTLNIPVLTTWKAIDFFDENDPLFVGRPGSIGQRGANFTQQNSDFFMSIGARLDFGQTAYNHKLFARAARKVIVDVDNAEIGKLDMSIDILANCDASEFISEFLRQIEHVQQNERSEWWQRCREWKAKYPVILPEYLNGTAGINTYALIDVLSEEMQPTDLLVPGVSGQCSEITMQAFKVKAGQRIYSSHGLGAMGFGIPASLAGCIASGGRRTVCVDGDGGFHMNTQELETVRRLNLPVKYFVLNNQGYGSIRATQRNYFNNHFVASSFDGGLSLPSTTKVAEAYGIPAVSITDYDHLVERVRAVLQMEGPVVCDVLTPFDQPTQPRVASRQLPNGQMVSSSMEDLFPFLEREEFFANMIIPPAEPEM